MSATALLEPRQLRYTIWTLAHPTRPLPSVHLFTVVAVTLLFAGVSSTISMSAGVADAYGDATHHLAIARRVFDSQTPGFAQLGTVWLPLPHIIFMPFVAVTPFFWNGAAGAIVGAGCLVVSSVTAFLIAWRATGRALAGYTAITVLLANPNLLYLQSSGMTEPLSIAVLCVQAYAMMRWVHRQSVGDLLFLAVITAVGVSIRYDGWFVSVIITAIVVAVTLTQWHNEERATANGITVFAGSAFVMGLWFFYNWLIFGNPLEFQNGALAPATQAEQLGTIGATKWHVVTSTYTYLTAVYENLGPVVLGLGVVTVLWVTVSRFRDSAIWALVVLAAAAAFNIVSLVLGQSTILTAYTEPPGNLNIRYGIQALPMVAIASGLAVGAVRGRALRRVVAAAIVMTIGVQTVMNVMQGPASIRTLAEATRDHATIQGAVDAANWYRDHRGPEDIGLFYTLATSESARFFMHGRTPIRAFVTENNAGIWKQTMDDPARYADWLIIPPTFPGRNDPVRGLLSNRELVTQTARFDRVEVVSGWEFYRRSPLR